MTMIKTEDLIATTNTTKDILGHLFWFSIGKQMNKVDDLKLKLINSGLGEEWMPNRIRSVDAFRRATKEVQTKKPTTNAKVFKNFLIREVYSDNKFVQRNIVVETVDQNDKKLGYDTQTGVMKLDKKNGTILFDLTDSNVAELCKEAERRFFLYRDHYSSQHIRVMITKILNSLAPTPMREKGVIYFIPNTRTTGLTNLVTFIQQLENSDAFKVPVIDSNDNRDMVCKKLTDHLQNLLKQCQSSEYLRKDQIKKLVEDTNNAIKDFKEYRNLITTETEDFEDQILLLRSEVLKIIQE
ncbi:DUF6744 family protein [Lentibacillus sp. N15]|uniref:DUF6744 family protein n=1 Tax=Lentibacillus songyuanensis TaxID=3136161 RepID=UPI0031BAAD20